MSAHNFLEEILAHKKRLLQQKQAFYASLKKKTEGQKLSRYHLFKQRVFRPGRLNLIAEIKKASPSKGLIRRHFDVQAVAKIYADNGAAAVSVLTEEKYFLGKPAYVRQVSENFDVPVLTKDFILHEAQIFEAFINGASAVLLIMAILDDDQVKHLLKIAGQLDMDCLVEVHNEEELDRALKAGADIIGINNRDLKSFQVDLGVGHRLIPRVPEGKVIVVESGLKSRADVVAFRDLGAHAVLIGETFMAAEDIDEKVKELMRDI